MVTEREDLGGQRKYLNDSKASMPQIVKQKGCAEPNQLPAGPREKRPIGRLFSSSEYGKTLAACLVWTDHVLPP